MKIACVAYRQWAKEIYLEIQKIYHKNHKFLLITANFNEIDKKIKEFKPDLILWYGWSDLIDDKIISNYFSVMLHPSPLPKFRGGSPIQNQIINGETESAVTLFKMNNKVDQGDIIYQRKFSLNGELDEILSRITIIGIELSLKMIKNFNHLEFKKQDDSKASYYPRRKPEQSEITLEELKNSTSLQLYNKIRALQDPYPNAFIIDSQGKKLFLTRAKL